MKNWTDTRRKENKKMKRIGRSKEPTIHAIKNIPNNLKEKLGRTFFLGVRSAAYDCTGDRKLEYNISILPGVDGTDCSVTYFKTWPELLEYYDKLMKEGLPSE